MHINKLKWDSEFFKFNVGKIENTITNNAEFQEITAQMDMLNFNLCYYSSPQALDLDKLDSNSLEIKLVDTKTTFCKIIDHSLVINKYIKLATVQTKFKNQLIDLAIQSGEYSRFNIDKRIHNEKFKELYKLWIINSLERNIASEVLIYEQDSKLAGFVTLGEKNNTADIGIIAVDYPFRGKGIGKILMQSAEKWFANQGKTHMQVVTQGNNTAACKLYESCDFKIQSVEYFYHIWQN